MSNAFCLPITLSLAPHRGIVAALVALHCLPLPLVAIVALVADGFSAPFAWLLAAITAFSLALALRRQRLANGAVRLEAIAGDNPANAANAGNSGDWLLYRADGRHQPMQFIDAMEFGGFVLLLMAQDRRKFRLLIRARSQSRGQLHRLRVWRENRLRPPPRGAR